MKALYEEIVLWCKDYTKGMKLFPAVAIIVVTCLIIIAEIYASSKFYRRNLLFGSVKETPILHLMPQIYWFFSSFVIYGLVPIVVLIGFKKKLKDFGLGFGDWRLGLKALALFSSVMIIVVLIVLQTKTFSSHYPFNKHALDNLVFFLIYESFYVLYFFGWEFVFRGFMLFSLKPVMGNYAILVQMVPFALMHVGKPVPEVFASVFAGLLLGAFALRTRSMIYCFLLHAIAAVSMDIAVLLTR